MCYLVFSRMKIVKWECSDCSMVALDKKLTVHKPTQLNAYIYYIYLSIVWASLNVHLLNQLFAECVIGSVTTSEQNSETHRLLIRNSRKQHKATCWAGEILHQPHRTRHWHKAPADFAGAFSLAQTSWVGAEVKVFPASTSTSPVCLRDIMGHGRMTIYHMAVCQNLVPLVNIKIAGKWMFIPLKMVLIGIDPYPYCSTMTNN